MTHLRQIMLEELQRRNYSESTIAYIGIVEHCSRHFHQSPDQLGPEHIRQYQAVMFREWKLAPTSAFTCGHDDRRVHAGDSGKRAGDRQRDQR